MNDQPPNFMEEWMGSDVVMDVEETSLHVHNFILSYNSTVFKKMLSSNFKEKLEKRIKLPGKSKKSIVELLTYIYPYPPKFKGK